MADVKYLIAKEPSVVDEISLLLVNSKLRVNSVVISSSVIVMVFSSILSVDGRLEILSA